MEQLQKPPICPTIPITRALAKAKFTHKLIGIAYFVGMLGISTHAYAVNKIQEENAKLGNPEWDQFYKLGKDGGNPHDLEGYADKDSVNIGNSINFFVNANSARNPNYTLTIYRLGWYNGVGARKMTFYVSDPKPWNYWNVKAVTSLPLKSVTQTLPLPESKTGLIQANWVKSYTLNIPTNWVSGVYVAALVGNTTQEGQYIPFVVRDVNRSSDYLFQSSTTTWQAYNNWGGKSLYGYNSGNQPSRKISFSRPYADDAGLGSLNGWEINMLRFMEREGYDVTYQGNIDTHTGDGGLLNHKAVLSVGHDEYWTKAIRDNFEYAQKRGVSLGFFGANVGYWQIRMENNNRTIVGYKDYSAIEDPLAIDGIVSNNNLVTSRWRDPLWANRPENGLVGVMYAFGPKGDVQPNETMTTAKSDPTLANGTASHWAFSGTGLSIGAQFPQLVGYEADRIFDNGKTPANLEILTASDMPLTVVDHDSALSANYDPAHPKSHATVYSKACSIWPCKNATSTVFAAGSIQWAWGLDTFYKWPVRAEIPAVQKITRNVLAKMVGAPLP